MRLNSLLRLATAHPQLLFEHAEGYALLANEELASAIAAWKFSLLLCATALIMAVLGVALGGVAVMLWASMASDSGRNLAMLVAVPATPLAIALCCVIGLKLSKAQPLAELKRQFSADMALLREADSFGEGQP